MDFYFWFNDPPLLLSRSLLRKHRELLTTRQLAHSARLVSLLIAASLVLEDSLFNSFFFFFWKGNSLIRAPCLLSRDSSSIQFGSSSRADVNYRVVATRRRRSKNPRWGRRFFFFSRNEGLVLLDRNYWGECTFPYSSARRGERRMGGGCEKRSTSLPKTTSTVFVCFSFFLWSYFLSFSSQPHLLSRRSTTHKSKLHLRSQTQKCNSRRKHLFVFKLERTFSLIA